MCSNGLALHWQWQAGCETLRHRRCECSKSETNEAIFDCTGGKNVNLFYIRFTKEAVQYTAFFYAIINLMKTYVITGATSGIGKALAEYFVQFDNNIVYAGYRNEDKKLELEHFSNIIPFYVDYSKPETIDEATEFIKSKTDNVGTLLNVAGGVVAGAMEELDIKELRRQFDINVFGAVQFSQGLLDVLNHSKIINISSMSSYGIYPFIAPYCASKRALDILFNCFSLETKRDIKVVSVKPGVIATPLWTKSLKENEKTIEKCSNNFKNEINYMENNARKNEQKGLSIDIVVKKIAKIDSLKNPKPSYCIGIDSIATSIVAKLPQSVLNKIIKLKLKRIK